MEWGDAAGWAQAVGTVVAVYLAASVARRSDDRKRRLDLQAKVRALHYVYQEAISLLEQVIESAPDDDGFAPAPPPPEAFDAVIDAFSSAPIFELPRPHLASDLAKARRAVAAAKRYAALSGTHDWNDSEVRLQVGAQLHELRAAALNVDIDRLAWIDEQLEKMIRSLSLRDRLSRHLPPGWRRKPD